MEQAITILALLALPYVCLAASPFVMSLGGAKIGGLPEGWTVSKTGEGSGSEWAVVEETTAPGGKALMQTSNKGARPLFNLCIAEETGFKDLDVTVSFKAVSGEIDQGGGPVWRYQDANNYYVARMNPLENNYRVYKVVAGKRTQLASADVKVPAGEWHEIRIVHKDAQIQCYLDGKLHLEVEDDTFGAAENVELWTKADAQTRFVGFRVNSVGNPQPNADVLPTPPEGKTWKLVWTDEFDGTRLDDSKWVARPEGKRKGGWWSPKAIGLDGQGHLVISTYKDGDKFVDGCIVMQGKFEHAFGYYVARMKFQKEPGHWSAFWITGPGVSKVGEGGRNGTEIDVMEKPWLDERVQHTFHWDGYGKDHKSEGKVVKVPGVMEGFHTFAIWWSPEEYVSYVDGKETWRSKAGGVCQVPQYMLLSDEIGPWAGDITKADLPDKFLVDYVRVYDLVETG